MQLLFLGEQFNTPFVLCLGFFDCMHKGHVRLLERAKQLAEGRKVALFTFENNHFQTLQKDTKLIYTFDERLGLYRGLGVDAVISAHFDGVFGALSGKDFLRQILNYPVCCVVCGEDYTCGGDLMSASEVKNFLRGKVDVEVVETLKDGDTKISSSLVRQLLLQNQTEKANAFLSEPFFFEGTVSEGRHVGKTIGFPTVNLPVASEKLLPLGVYAGKARLQSVVSASQAETENFENRVANNSQIFPNPQHGADKIEFPAIVNVGDMPTFGVKNPCVEAHLLRFDGNLYGQKIKISLLKYIRPIVKFNSVSELSAQLQRDCEVADDQIRTEW